MISFTSAASAHGPSAGLRRWMTKQRCYVAQSANALGTARGLVKVRTGVGTNVNAEATLSNHGMSSETRRVGKPCKYTVKPYPGIQHAILA